jgi:hypothetical protein
MFVWKTVLLLVSIVGLSLANFASSSPYDILGVTRQTELSDVKKSFRSLALKFHPDKNPNCEDCVAKFQRINSAYDAIVADKKQSSEYPEMTTQLSNELFVFLDALKEAYNNIPEQIKTDVINFWETYKNSDGLMNDVGVILGSIISSFGIVGIGLVILYHLAAFLGFLWLLILTYRLIRLVLRLIYWVIQMVFYLLITLPVGIILGDSKWYIKRTEGDKKE